MQHSEVSVLVLDIGSTISGSFGWARLVEGELCGDDNIDNCCRMLAHDLSGGRRVALGIEAPGFMPVPQVSKDLSRGREGERDRSCFAPAGGYVAMLGLHELLFVLRGIRGIATCTLDWTAWAAGGPEPLLLWEAFVSGAAHTKTNDHVADAATAAVEFFARLKSQSLTTDVAVAPPREVFSLLGAGLLWAGLAEDAGALRLPALVIKPKARYCGVPAAVPKLPPVPVG